MPNFIQTLGEETLKQLEEMAKSKDIKVQELIRAVIIPEWLRAQKLNDVRLNVET